MYKYNIESDIQTNNHSNSSALWLHLLGLVQLTMKQSLPCFKYKLVAYREEFINE